MKRGENDNELLGLRFSMLNDPVKFPLHSIRSSLK